MASLSGGMGAAGAWLDGRYGVGLSLSAACAPLAPLSARV